MTAAIVVASSAVLCLLIAEWADARFARGAAKMSAASAFLAMALASGALESSYGQILFAGLVLCWIGDACLLQRGRSRGLLVGIAAFLLGHLAYAIAFYRLGLDPVGLFGGAVVIGALGMVALRWLRPHVPDDFRIPIFCYVGVVSLMVATSLGAYAGGASFVLPLGTLGFAISDVFVARERFVTKSFLNPGVGLPMYFTSQMLLAYTASFAIAA